MKDWNTQHSAQPVTTMEAYDSIAQNIMTQYKDELRPYAETVVKSNLYDNLTEKEQDAKLRKMCEGVEQKNPALYQQITADWWQQYTSQNVQNIDQANSVAKGLLQKYKKELMPYAETSFKTEMTVQKTIQQPISANTKVQDLKSLSSVEQAHHLTDMRNGYNSISNIGYPAAVSAKTPNTGKVKENQGTTLSAANMMAMQQAKGGKGM